MTLSRRGDYVMRSAISLARAFDGGAPRKIREVVADTEVPQSFASQILADLVRAGLATSKAGRDGGYRLARPPQEISVLEVVEAAEGPLRAERCALGEGPCRWEAVCPLHETWTQATVLLRDLLARTDLAELAARDVAIEMGDYALPADSHRSRPAAVTVSDAVQVELAAPELNVALARFAPDLGRLVGAAAQEALADGNGARPRGRRVRAADASLVPVSENAGSGGPGAARYLLAWRITGRGLGSRLEADASIVALDAERSELSVEGTWYQDAEPVARLTAPELERQAQQTLRIFLRRFARALEPEPRPRLPRAAATNDRSVRI